MKVEVVLLDAAGTLIEVQEPVGETYARVAYRHGAASSAERLAEAFGRAMADAPEMVFPDATPGEIPLLEKAWWHDRVEAVFRSAGAALVPGAFEACFETLYAHYAKADAWRLCPGAIDALGGLQARGLRLAVVSNFDRRLEPLLEGLGVRDRFEAIILPSDAGAAKPSPRIFRHALEQLGVPAAVSVFVGDDAVQDVAGARAEGIHAIDATALATLAALPAAVDTLMSSKESSA